MIGGIWLLLIREQDGDTSRRGHRFEVTTDIARNAYGTYSFKGVLS